MSNQVSAQEEKSDPAGEGKAPSGCAVIFVNGAFALTALLLFGAMMSALDNSMPGGFRAWLTIFLALGLIILANIAGIFITKSQKQRGGQVQLLKFLLYGNGITLTLLVLILLIEGGFSDAEQFSYAAIFITPQVLFLTIFFPWYKSLQSDGKQ